MHQEPEESLWPKEVRRMTADAREAGLNPVVRGEPGGEWEIRIEGSHVVATAAYQFRNGKTKQARGILQVDGKDHPLASTITELREIWARYEEQVPDPGLAEITDPGDRPVPAAIRAAADALRRAVAPHGLEVRCGLSGDDWAVGFDLGNGDGLRVLGGEYPHIQLILGGEDRSAEAGGQLGKAMALFAAYRSSETPAGAPAVRQQPGYRNQGVETRGMVVRRELRMVDVRLQRRHSRDGRSGGRRSHLRHLRRGAGDARRLLRRTGTSRWCRPLPGPQPEEGRHQEWRSPGLTDLPLGKEGCS